MPIRTFDLEGGEFGRVPHRSEKGTSASKDAGPEGSGLCESPTHVGWREKRNTLVRVF